MPRPPSVPSRKQPVATRAIARNPRQAEAHFNQALAHQSLGQWPEALASYDRAISFQRDFAAAYFNRALVQKALNQREAAVASYDAAIAAKPDWAEACYNRGNLLQELNRLAEAVASYDRAIRIKPDWALAWSNRGNALKAQRQFTAALASLDHAIGLKPDWAEVHSNRGFVLQLLGHFDEALVACDRAIGFDERLAEAWSNRGLALQGLRQLDEALESYDRAIAIKPELAEAHYNRGNVLQELKRMDQAHLSYDRAIAISPQAADPHWNKAIAFLLCGQWLAGWALYEWRWRLQGTGPTRRAIDAPLWLGAEPLSGKTILLHHEQGLGDTLQMCRYAPMVKALGASVVLEAPKPLLGLLSTLEGIDALIESGSALPSVDFHCPLLSLPLAFKTEPVTVPATRGYLKSDQAKRAQWVQRLGAKSRPRVGLVWSGSTIHPNDRNRSVSLAALTVRLPPHLDYVCLQNEVREIDAEPLRNSSIRHVGDELVEFADTAALCDLMDLVISVDTSVAHLAGAMGKPTWVLLPYAPDWRWLLGRDDSPWYDSVTLYRQQADWSWDAVLDRMTVDLHRRFDSPAYR